MDNLPPLSLAIYFFTLNNNPISLPLDTVNLAIFSKNLNKLGKIKQNLAMLTVIEFVAFKELE